jgi:hypothetical protein
VETQGFFEALEKRQLLSADLASAACGDPASELLDAIGARLALTLDDDDARPPVAALARAASATVPATPPPIAAELLGEFHGTVRDRQWFGSFRYGGFLYVTAVTATGMTASLGVASNIDGTAHVAGTFTGKVNRKGGFAYRLREDHARASFRGKIVPQNDRLVGKVRVKSGGKDLGGSFKLDRQPT